MENNKYKNSKKKNEKSFGNLAKNGSKQPRSRVLSLAQLLSRVRKQRGLSNLSQSNSATLTNAQTRGMQNAGQTQFGAKVGSFGNGNPNSSFGRAENKVSMMSRSGVRSFGDQGLSAQRENKIYSGMTKAQIRLETQKEDQKRQKPIKPIIPPKSLVIILREKPEKIIYNRRIIDYKHCGLLQRYIGLGGKILPRRQTRLTAKQQRYIAKTIKSARIMGLLPFVSKEKGFFR